MNAYIVCKPGFGYTPCQEYKVNKWDYNINGQINGQKVLEILLMDSKMCIRQMGRLSLILNGANFI